MASWLKLYNAFDAIKFFASAVKTVDMISTAFTGILLLYNIPIKPPDNSK